MVLVLISYSWSQTKLPTTWVNSNEWNGVFSINVIFPSVSTGGSWSCGITSYGPYTAGSFSSLQQAVNDMEACRTAGGAGLGIVLSIPPGVFTAAGSNGLIIPQTGASTSNTFLVLRSTLDVNFPYGRTVCSHGIQDNLATSLDIGLNNPDCTGQNMYYQLGPTLTAGTISGITTLSTNTTTLAAIATGVHCIALANGYVAPGVSEVVDTAGNQETVTTTSGVNQTGMCGNFTKTHLAGVAVTYNVGAFSLANTTPTNTSAYNDVASMWTIQAQATGNSTAVTFCYASASAQVPTCTSNFGPDHWIFQDMEARLFAGNLGNAFIVQAGGVSNDTSQAQLSTHIHFQRSWFHGDWTSTLTGANAIAGGLDFECLYCSLMDSQISEIMRPGNESHPATVQGDQVKLNHNWADSGSEGFFSGGFSGGSGPTIFGWTAFCDVEVRRNRFSYPFAWLGQSPILGGANPNYPTNFSTVRKNSQENKSGCRAEFSGNIMEDVDNSGAQNGVMTELNPRNNSSGNGTNYLATVHDMTVQNNIYRNGCQAINVTTSNGGPGGGTAYPPRNLEISNNLWYNIGITNYGCSSFSGLQANSGGGTWQGTITQTDASNETFVAECSVDSGGCIGQVNSVTITGGVCGGSPTLSFSTPNIAGGNLPKATVHCSGTAFTVPSLTQFGTGYTSPPTVTLTCAGCTGGPVAAAIINGASSGISTATGFQSFNVTLGDPVPITQCQTASFNTVGTTLHAGSYVPSGIGPGANGNSTVWNGSYQVGNVTVSAAHAGTAGTTETSHYCKFTTLQGAPYSLHWNHNTLVSNSTHVLNSSSAFNNSDTDGPIVQLNEALQNSLFTAGDWGSSAVGSGTVAEQYWADTVNTLTADHLVFPGQTSANYTPFGLNPFFPVLSPVMYFPTTAYCPGASASPTCIGFIGAMSAISMPLTLADYHNFALINGSSFQAGAADQAPDGLDVGDAIPALDVAQTQNIYVCKSACGSGPFPDVLIPSASFGTAGILLQ